MSGYGTGLFQSVELGYSLRRFHAITGAVLALALILGGCSSPAIAGEGDAVKVHYTGTLDDGSVFDSSRQRDPLEFTIGQGQVIEGFEQAVTGMQVGETRTVHIPSDQAYGPYRQDLVFEVEKGLLPEGTQVGQTLEMTQADGSRLYVTVAEIGESTATLDANHSLAGKDLNFEIELVEIG